MPVAVFTHQINPGILYGVAAVYGLLKMISLAGFPALIPALAPDEALTQANALEGASYGLASLVGAGLGAALIVTDAATTVVAMVALGFLTAPMTAWAQTIRMRAVPEQMHGRLFAVLRTAMQATPPIGAAIAGGLASAGAAATVACVAGFMAVPVVVCV